ncbi:MAG TPA: DUF29 domain-containing protein [Stellaceae bacterium]|nr:DUF29 domain-containing protein [Stellaceae bacterium]
MSDAKALYDEDFVAWSKDQAEALRAEARAGSNQKLDWENLAEEIESLGKSQRHELRSQVRRVIEHLLKLECSLAMAPRRGWCESISDARSEIDLILRDSPSLKREVRSAIAIGLKPAARKAIFALEEHAELNTAARARIQAMTYTEEQILGDWFPPGPPPSSEYP